MKQILYLFTSLVLASCGQPSSQQKITTDSDSTTTYQNINKQKKSTEEIQSDENYQEESLSGFEKATLYQLTDTIAADYNGDGIIDKAFFKKENETSGIIIKHGKTNEEVRIGFGKQFYHMTEFNWVDYWGLVEDRETSETKFSEDGDVLGSKNVKLQNPSIALGAIEQGGGLITFINGKYVWIHQTS